MPKSGTAAEGALGCGYYDGVYEKSASYSAPWEESHYLELWMKILEAFEAKGATSVYEIGCGTGQLASCLSAKMPDLEYRGIDFSEKAIDIARSKSDSDFQVADLRDEGLFDYDFDTLVATEVFEHIDDDREFIKRIPDGKLVIFSVPNFDDPAHVRFFTGYTDVASWYSPCFKLLDISWIRKGDTQYGYWLGVGRR